MKRTKFIAGIIIMLFWGFQIHIFAQFVNIKGNVTSAGKGISNVVITDGTNVVKTDAKGNFKIMASALNGFIYYSLPKDYDSPVVDGVPVFYSPIQKDKKEQTVRFEINKSSVSQQKHAFILWADPQVANHNDLKLLEKVKQDVKLTVASLQSHMPVHGISAGDLVFDQKSLYGDYKNVIKDINIPFYQVIGNHDMDYSARSNEFSDVTYSASFGPSHYSFNVGNIHYVVLKDIFYFGNYIGYVDENQLSWLEKDLQFVVPGSTVIVSIHIPTTYGESQKASDHAYFMSNEVMNKKGLFDILKPFDTHILAGHSHTQWNTVLAPNILEHVHAAACAAWWQAEIGTDGTPKGYTVYLVDNDRLSWYFKGVNQDKSEQFRVYEKGTDVNLPDYFIVNVYNYDPQWKISWYENGVYQGEMEQYWGKDPLAVQTFSNRGNKGYSWITVEETRHLFRAKPEKSQSDITVEVKDRFGNVYKKEIKNRN